MSAVAQRCCGVLCILLTSSPRAVVAATWLAKHNVEGQAAQVGLGGQGGGVELASCRHKEESMDGLGSKDD